MTAGNRWSVVVVGSDNDVSTSLSRWSCTVATLSVGTFVVDKSVSFASGRSSVSASRGASVESDATESLSGLKKSLRESSVGNASFSMDGSSALSTSPVSVDEFSVVVRGGAG